MHGVITEQKKAEVETAIAAFRDRAPNADVVKAASFLVMRDAGYTMAQIAEQWDCDRRTVYNWLDGWKKSGALKEAEALWLLPKIEEIRKATSNFITEYPQMIEKLKWHILNTKSPMGFISMLDWAKKNIVDPEIGGEEDAGAPESAYARRAQGMSIPMIISAPPPFKKQGGAG